MNPYFEISQLNSLRFVKEQDWNTTTNIPNVSNTLSYQESGLNHYDYYQLFQLNDKIKIQFKSNYDDHNIEMKHCVGSNIDLGDINQMTNNLGHKDRRTCKIRPYGQSQQTVLYFGEGDVLDYDNGTTIDDYDLGQKLPEWMKIGQEFIYIQGTYTENAIALGVVWLEEVQMYGVLTDIQQPQAEVSGQIKLIYDLEDYEIYEFDIEFSLYPAGKYQVEISAFGSGIEDLIVLSERIDLQEKHNDTHLIICSNDQNNQVNYFWSIEHLMRIPFETQMSYSPNGKNEIHKTDNRSYFVNSENFEVWKVEFVPMPTAMAIKLVASLSLSNIKVDSRNFVLEEKPEVEKLEDSNLYKVSASMILSH